MSITINCHYLLSLFTIVIYYHYSLSLFTLMIYYYNYLFHYYGWWWWWCWRRLRKVNSLPAGSAPVQLWSQHKPSACRRHGQVGGGLTLIDAPWEIQHFGTQNNGDLNYNSLVGVSMDVHVCCHDLSCLRQNPQALRISETERNQQLQHLTKTCADLAESNRGWDIRCNCFNTCNEWHKWAYGW